MAWTEFTRPDVSDAEWALTEPLMPAPKKAGRPRTTGLRDVFDAILCIATTGCQGPWLGRCRRMARDWEKTAAGAEAWLLART